VEDQQTLKNRPFHTWSSFWETLRIPQRNIQVPETENRVHIEEFILLSGKELFYNLGHIGWWKLPVVLTNDWTEDQNSRHWFDQIYFLFKVNYRIVARIKNLFSQIMVREFSKEMWKVPLISNITIPHKLIIQ
jgi:hypothetical protein